MLDEPCMEVALFGAVVGTLAALVDNAEDADEAWLADAELDANADDLEDEGALVVEVVPLLVLAVVLTLVVVVLL